MSAARPRFEIPGILWRCDPEGEPVPLVLDSPHSGREYPADFRYVCPFQILRTAEDCHVDELYGAAPALGATLIAARFPRSYLDPNRAADDLDLALVEDGDRAHFTPHPVTRVGLVRRYAQPGVPIYGRPLRAAEIEARIARCHAPYHRVLDEACDRLHERFGTVWHLNCHSMPSHEKRRPGRRAEHADFVLGNRDGTTCAPEFTLVVAQTLRGLGYDVRVNEGYKGVEIVRRQGRPAERRHSLQIEIDRALYMDQKTLEKLPGFARVQADLTRLVAALRGFVREALGA